MKDGKKPLAEKKRESGMIRADEIFGTALSLPEELKEELEKKGLVGRWVNATELTKFQGYHPKGWKVYKKDSGTISASGQFRFGNDPDGVIRRGDCILAVKTAEEVSKHKAFLKQRADIAKGVSGKAAAEMREALKQNQVKSTVVEGYDDGDDE